MLKALKNELEREVFSREFRGEFERIIDSPPLLESFGSPVELIQYMQDKDEKDFDKKDDILKSLIEIYNSEESPSALGSLLILLQWPSLINVFHSCKSQATDLEDLWSEVQCGFLEAVRNYPVVRRDSRVAANLKYLTLRHVFQQRNAEIREIKAQEKILERAKARLEESGFSDLPAESMEETIWRLHRLVDEGILSEIDFHLIVETRIFRNKLYEIATKLGLKYETAKSRRFRAEKSLREHFENIF